MLYDNDEDFELYALLDRIVKYADTKYNNIAFNFKKKNIQEKKVKTTKLYRYLKKREKLRTKLNKSPKRGKEYINVPSQSGSSSN
jgi:hypothetical protein